MPVKISVYAERVVKWRTFLSWWVTVEMNDGENIQSFTNWHTEALSQKVIV